jgi:O-antigen ligase
MKKIIPLLESKYLWTVILSIYIVSLFFSNEFTIAAFILFITAVSVRFIYTIWYKKEQVSKPQVIAYFWMAVYLVRVLWLLVSPDTLYGLKWLDTCLPIFLLPLALQYYPLTERMIKWVLAFFVRSSFIFCLISLFSIVYHIFSVPIAITEWVHNPKNYYPFAFMWTNYIHPSFLCMIYLLALPTGLYLRKKYHNISIAELVLLFLVEALVVYLTGSRIGIIIIPLLLFLMILHCIRQRKQRHIAAAIMMGIGITGVIFWLFFHDSVPHLFHDPIRAHLWETAISSIQRNPLLGVGTGGMKELIVPINAEFGKPEWYITYPHNQYLGEVMHFGFIGAIPLFATLIYMAILAIRRKDILLQSFLIILIIAMYSDMPFDICKTIHISLFFSSLFLTIYSPKASIEIKVQEP